MASLTKSIGYGVIGFADVLQRLRPDMLMVLGDRYEILAAAQAAVIARVPVAHLCGGDTVDGAFEGPGEQDYEAFRVWFDSELYPAFKGVAYKRTRKPANQLPADLPRTEPRRHST